eukprot:5462116-Lingulodinium_polyedra.AAC.1
MAREIARASSMAKSCPWAQRRISFARAAPLPGLLAANCAESLPSSVSNETGQRGPRPKTYWF